MRVSLLYNGRSGRGQAAPLANDLCAALNARGHDALQFELSVNSEAGTQALAHGDVVCVLGGDGSVHHTLPLLIGSHAALYHVPLGTENLFSRDWGMSRDPAAIVAAVDRFETMQIDVGHAGDRPFALMVSLGPDASIIHRVQAGRTGPITHLSYVRPAIEEFISPSLGPVSVIVDGETIVRNTSGICVIANSSQYGGRIDPAARASLTDGRLDVFFAPAQSGVDIAACLMRSRLREDISSQGVIYRQGATIQLDAGNLPSQIDGEHFLAATGSLTLKVLPLALKILRA